MGHDTDPTLALVGALRSVVRWLDSTSLAWMIIGGVAASILGRPRLTRDVDVLVLAERSAWSNLLIRAAEHNLVARIDDPIAFASETRVLLLRHQPSGIDVDVSFGALPFEEEAVDRATRVSVGGVDLPLPTPEDLIIMKAVAHRHRDLADIEGIVAAHPDLDRDRIVTWVTEFSDLLEMPELLADLTARL